MWSLGDNDALEEADQRKAIRANPWALLFHLWGGKRVCI